MYIMQNSFTGGEFAPSMESRQDFQKYSSGLRTMENFFVKPQGAAVNRPGTYYVASTKDSAKVCRLIPFIFSESIAYILEFGDYYVRFYRNGGQLSVSTADAWASGTDYVVGDYVLENSLIYHCITAHTASVADTPGTGADWADYWEQSAIYEVVTPYAADDVADLKFTQSADVLFLAHSSYKPKTLTRYGDTNWTMADFAFKLGPFAPMNTTTTTITPSGTLTVDGTVTLTASADVFTSDHVGALFRLDQDIEAQTVSASLSSGTGSATSSTMASSDSAYTMTTTITGTWVGANIALQYSSDSSTWTTLYNYTANGTFTFTTATSTYYRLYITGVSSGSCVATATNTVSTITATAAPNNTTNPITGWGPWIMTTHGTWAGKIYVERSEDAGTTWTKVREFSSNSEYNVDYSGTEEDDIVMLRVRMYSYTSGTCNVDLQFEPFTAYGIAKITSVTSGTVAKGTVKQQFGSTASTKYWYQGAWSESRGWPSAVVFYQNRLVFGATTSEPQTLWASQSGDYINFGVSASVVDSDAITTPLVSDKVNAIKSLKALSKIIGLTAGGYWIIGAGDSGSVFTPSSQSASAEGYFGASSLDPVIIGNRILFAGSKGSVVRDMGYDIQSEAYIAVDLTLYAEHLFKDRTVSEWAYAQDPYGIVWCVCDDGTLLGLTYLKEQNICAWHRHETDGTFESVCVIPGTDRDQVWFVVNRTVDGKTVRYVEMMAARTTTPVDSTNDDGEAIIVFDPAEQYFVDGGITYSLTTAAKIFTGLDHLEGKTVSILADGNVHPTKTVSGGSVTLDYAAKVVHIGLPYTCDLETLDVDFQAQDGTIQTRYKKISKVHFRFEYSRGAKAGPTFNTLYEFKERSNEAYGEPIALYTGDREMTFNNGSNTKGRICVRVEDPLPVTLLATVAEVELG